MSLLTPAVAAVGGTVGELALPVLLAIGQAVRFAAAGLSVLHVVAVPSLAEIAPAALGRHQLWGTLLLGLLLWGPGRWSLVAGRVAEQARLALSCRPAGALAACAEELLPSSGRAPAER